MRAKVQLLVAGFCALTAVLPARAQIVVGQGLIADYDFTRGSLPNGDGVIKDLSGNGIHATIRPTGPPPLPRTGWLAHDVLQGDGKGGWLTRPAHMQILRKAEGKSTIPFGIAQMDNGEIALICSWHNGQFEQPVIAFSQDAGDTWTEFMTIDGARGRPMNLAYLGEGRLTFRSNRRFFSNDYGRTWPESVPVKRTAEGRPFYVEGNALVEYDENGTATRIAELG